MIEMSLSTGRRYLIQVPRHNDPEIGDYLLWTDVPNDILDALEEWMRGQTMGTVDGQIVIYWGDFERFCLGKPVVD